MFTRIQIFVIFWLILFFCLFSIQYKIASAIFASNLRRLAYRRTPVRIYCGVPTTVKRMRWWEDIYSTWGHRCDVIKFFINNHEDGPMIPDKVGDAEVVRLPMVRKPGEGKCGEGPCRHISEKTWRMWQYMYKNEMAKADFFLKVDDDTFFMPEKLRHYVNDFKISPNEPRYFGHRVWPRGKDFQIISGVCTVLTREAVLRLGVRLETIKHEYGPRQNFPNSRGTCVDRDGATEELVIAKCLTEVGVYAEDALEDGTKETVLPLGIPFTLNYKRKVNTTGWIWNGKPWTRGDLEECCSHKYTFGIHGYKGAGHHLKKMYRMVYEMSDSELKETLKHKKEGPEMLRFITGLRANIRV